MTAATKARDPIQFSHEITVTGALVLTELEMGALVALVGYGEDAFLKTFYGSMGREYLQPFEPGLRSLFATIRATCPQAMHDLQRARTFLFEAEQARRRELLAPPTPKVAK